MGELLVIPGAVGFGLNIDAAEKRQMAIVESEPPNGWKFVALVFI